MKNLKILSVGIAMLLTFLTFGQEKTITGIVSDNQGALPGVIVQVKGTKNTVSTDFSGNYSIKTKVGDVLTYSFIEMNTVEETVGTSNVINVVLKQNTNTLQEVVVAGYGVKKNKNLVYKISRTRALTQASNPNIIQILQGKVSGLAIDKSNNYTKNHEENKVIKNSKGYLSNDIKNDEEYNSLIENAFESPKNSPLSTFSIDVDNASYTNVRRFINSGQKVPKDAVRVEEMMNFLNILIRNRRMKIRFRLIPNTANVLGIPIINW